MTLLHFDGHRSYADINDYIQTVTEKVSHFQDGYGDHKDWNTAYSRFGSPDRGVKINYSNRYLGLELDNSLSPSTVILGIAFKKYQAGTPTLNTGYPTIRIRDNMTDNNDHLIVCVNGSYDFQVYRKTTLLGISSGKKIIDQAWHFLEIKLYIHGTAGTVELKLDGAQILNLTNQDTLEGSNAYARAFVISCIGSHLDVVYDCWYLCDNAGSAPQNDFLGDARCDVIRPNGVGNKSDFTPSAGSNYENVDEITPDDDTTKNSSGTVNHQDSYALPSLASGGTIFGVKPKICIAKTDAGAKGVKILTRSNITFYKSAEVNPLTSYGSFGKIYQDNPDDAAAWEEADVNGMEVGIEVSS